VGKAGGKKKEKLSPHWETQRTCQEIVMRPWTFIRMGGGELNIQYCIGTNIRHSILPKTSSCGWGG